MKAAVIVFPGSNCDRDLAVAFRAASGVEPVMVWHKDTALPAGIDVVGVPGGFSFGDYLRCGAIAARSPICRAVVDFAGKGGPVLGICNGFQVLVDEDGRSKKLEINHNASAMAGKTLVGPALVLFGDAQWVPEN